MNYLTNHYRNKAEVLAQKIALLENVLSQTNMGRPSVSGSAGGPVSPTSKFGTPKPNEPGVNFPGVAGSAGGPGQPTTFNGAVLGQLLSSGDMNAVYQYLSQFYGNDMTTINALLASFGYNQQGSAGGQGGAGQAFSGAQLGQLLGQGNMNSVNQYLGQFGGQYPTQSGPASVSGRMNAPRTARRGGVRPASGG